MLKLGFYIDQKEIAGAVLALLSLLPPMRPVHFSEEDSIGSDRDLVDDTDRFQLFQNLHPSGFFLFSDACIYTLLIRNKDYSLLNVHFNEDVATQALVVSSFETLSAVVRPKFGFAADVSEYEHRNRLFRTIGINKIETWVGRDLRNAVPGLYWMTLLSAHVSNEHGVNLALLQRHAISFKHVGNEAVLFRFFEQAGEWLKYAPKLDRLCKDVDGVFSISDVESATVAAATYLEFSEIVQAWK